MSDSLFSSANLNSDKKARSCSDRSLRFLNDSPRRRGVSSGSSPENDCASSFDDFLLSGLTDFEFKLYWDAIKSAELARSLPDDSLDSSKISNR